MPRQQPSDIHAHPRDLVAEAVHDYGEHAVIDMCLALLDGHTDYDLLPLPLSYLGGAHAVTQLGRGHNLVMRRQEHWPRAWAARALRYVWQPYAEPGVVAALSDPAWRVRETAAKLVGQRELGSGAEALVPLVADESSRVRAAAIRALGVVGEYEHAVLLADLDDHEVLVRIAIEGARRRLRVRLDRAV
ncbi:MAG TPA: HEAT repeat domain-containing protein [Nocardioidaceae bacterium]|nr:HEAT repeat domain-containing protein [Nocardioidaceae bacterium]